MLLRKVSDDKVADLLTSLVYLWTRDAKLEVNDDTETYVIQHMRAAYRTVQFSPESFIDQDRYKMARRLVETQG